RHLGKVLPGAIRNDGSITDRSSDRSFENCGIDESRLGMNVTRRRTAGTIFDKQTLHTFARHIRHNVVEDHRDLWTFVFVYPRAHAESDDDASDKCGSEGR